MYQIIIYEDGKEISHPTSKDGLLLIVKDESLLVYDIGETDELWDKIKEVKNERQT